MRRLGSLGCFAAFAVACSVPNPEFDPPRKNDTEPLPSDDGDDGTTVEIPTDAGEETEPSDDTGSPPAVCNNQPENFVALRIFEAGNPVQRCGMATERECILGRNDTEMRWELSGCCLEGELCGSETTYVLEFGPTGPAVVADPMQVSIRFEFTAEDVGCKLAWVQIDEVETALPPGAPPLVYMAAASLDANQFVSVPAEPGDVLPGEICECAQAEADCCPEDLGRHTLHVNFPPSPQELDPTSPSHVVPIADSELAIEMILVRAWQPPFCAAEPEYEWIVRRLYL